MNIYEDDETPKQEEAQLTYEQFKEYKAVCEGQVKLSEQAIRLAENEDFKTIVMDAYFDKEPKRLAGLMATGRLPENQFNDCVSDIRSIGSMRSFLQEFIQRGEVAKGELKNLEEAWNEAVEAGDVLKDGGIV